MSLALIIQLLSGAAGGNLAGAVLKNLNMGWLWNSISGILGGGLAGSVLGPMIGLGGAPAGGMDLTAILGQVLQGGVGGGALMAIVGVLKGMAGSK